MWQNQPLTKTHNLPLPSVKANLFMPNSWFRHKLDAGEQFAIDVIMGRSEGTRAALLGVGLQGLAYVFSGLVQLRLWLYRKRILRDQPLGCLVLVVGNLTVGVRAKLPWSKCSRRHSAIAAARSQFSRAVIKARRRRFGRNGGFGSIISPSRRRGLSVTALRYGWIRRSPVMNLTCWREICRGW